MSLLRDNSEKTVVSVGIKDTEEAGLSEKIIKDLNNPKSTVAKKVNEAIEKAWGVHMVVEYGKLVMVSAKDKGGAR